VAKFRFTDDVTTSAGSQVIVVLGAAANAVALLLYLVEGRTSVAGILLRIVGLACPLFLLIASINGRRYRRQQESDRR
jgi:hypothetical protein